MDRCGGGEQRRAWNDMQRKREKRDYTEKFAI